MAGESFTRQKQDFRFEFGGFKTNDQADVFPPNKYPLAVNVRGYANHSVTSRPGQVLSFATGTAAAITDISTYAAIQTDDKPRILARDVNDAVWLDNATQVGTLAAGGPGATFIPFRPNASPQPYMYVANSADYQKFPAPSPGVVPTKVGIAEPQDGVQAAPLPQTFTELLAPGGQWTTGGTASGWYASTRSADIVVTAQNDPVFANNEVLGRGPVPPRWSVQVGANVQYQRGEVLYFVQSATGLTFITVVEEVIAPLSISMSVQAVYYFGGVGGPGTAPNLAVVTLQGVSFSGKLNTVANQSGQILSAEEVVASLRRGALVMIGTETTYVRSVTTGPDNQICIEVFLNNVHVAGEPVIGLPTIVVNNCPNAAFMAPGVNIIGDGDNTLPGPTGTGNVENFAVATGIGTLTSGAGAPTGTLFATPAVSLNGWGPNAHVGAYELNENENFGWGLNPQTTQPYNNPGNATDGSTTTFASGGRTHGHTYYGCIWTFPAVAPASNMSLNINSKILSWIEINTLPGHGTDLTGPKDTQRSAGIWYSLDNGTTWIQIYNIGYTNSPGFLGRAQQWDSVPLPASQVVSNIQVMAFADAHDNMWHYVYEINITQGAQALNLANIGAYQVNDYLHFSINVDNPANLIELRFQIDVADGTFQDNYYYYSVRPSDLVAATTATAPTTQLAATQAINMEGLVNEQADHQNMFISAPTVAGSAQWTEIWTPISGLTRVGGDETKTLVNINAIQIWVNCTGTVNVSVSSYEFIGTGQPDDGEIGEPYRYRVVAYSSTTGAKSNPSPDMRYGITLERQMAQLNLPLATYDSQIDTWWVYRFGGSVLSWRFIGQVSSAIPIGNFNPVFVDIYDDAAAQAGDELEFDNFEPWPSIDVPFGTPTAPVLASSLVGFIAVVNVTPPSNIARFLPGNLVRLAGTNVFTLRKRPVSLGGGAWELHLDECTAGILPQGAGTILTGPDVALNIYEPEIARQFVPYMWGPDATGTIFAVGDPLRAGTFYFSKPSQPDSAPDAYNQELCPPSEPLLGGIIIDGLAYIASTSRWWALYPQLDNPAQRYAPQQAPFPRGLAAPYGICTDGQSIFWWGEDGIWSSTKGSLSDADLYTLFPHEGIAGVPHTYGTPPLGKTVNPPDYSRTGTFRIAYNDDYLYCTYQDTTGMYNTLVYDTRRECWVLDQYATSVTTFYQVTQEAGTVQTVGTLYPDLLMADTGGHVLTQQMLTNDNGAPIPCQLARFEFDGGDVRAPKQWGDMFMDARIFAPAGLNVTPMSLGAPVASGTVNIPPAAGRQRNSIGMGANPVVSDFMGCMLTWTEDFSAQAAVTTLYIWQPSYSILPARLGGSTASGGTGTGGFATFGTSFSLPGYGHIPWVSLAYISTAPVTLTITTYDGQSPQVVTLPSTGGQYQKTLFRVSANKGQLFRFSFSSPAQFQVFNDDSDIMVGAWQRTGPYADLKTFEVPVVDSAPL
jgi:hypothetical protein